MNPTEDINLIGILFVGTGKYIDFLPGFIDTFQKHFLPTQRKRYFVYSDKPPKSIQGVDIRYCEVPLEPWPMATLRRYDYFLSNAKEWLECSHVIFANANLRPQNEIEFDEIFGDGSEDVFGTRHPGYAFKKKKIWHRRSPGDFETNPKSTAYMRPGHHIYFAGGFNGGTTEAWLRLSGSLSANIRADLARNVNGTGWAKWHDESHINHYFNEISKPRILSPSYLYPEGWNLPCERKILILDKSKLGGHDALRSIQTK